MEIHISSRRSFESTLVRRGLSSCLRVLVPRYIKFSTSNAVTRIVGKRDITLGRRRVTCQVSLLILRNGFTSTVNITFTCNILEEVTNMSFSYTISRLST